MARKPDLTTGRTNFSLSLTSKRCLVALSNATNTDMIGVLEEALRRYADDLIRQNPAVVRQYPDLRQCDCIKRRR